MKEPTSCEQDLLALDLKIIEEATHSPKRNAFPPLRPKREPAADCATGNPR